MWGYISVFLSRQERKYFRILLYEPFFFPLSVRETRAIESSAKIETLGKAWFEIIECRVLGEVRGKVFGGGGEEEGKKY